MYQQTVALVLWVSRAALICWVLLYQAADHRTAVPCCFPLDPPTPVSASTETRASVLCMNGPFCFHVTLCFYQQGDLGLRQALQGQ